MHTQQQPEDLRQWLHANQRLFALQERRIALVSAELFGYYALELGLDEKHQMVSGCRQHNLINLATAWPPQITLPHTCQPLYADPHYLPFPDDSIDLVVVHHLLEYSSEPHQVIHQAARIVIPEGKLLVFGTNPFSTQGIMHLVRKPLGKTWRVAMPSPWRIRDWLKLLGFTNITISYQCPGRQWWEKRLGRLSGLAARSMPPLGGSWCVLATRRKLAKIMPRPIPGALLGKLSAPAR